MYPETVTLSRAEIDLLIDPWRHDFTTLGLKTLQQTGGSADSQLSKQPRLCSLIDQAVGLCQSAKNSLRGVDLFCGDGFYSVYAAQHGAKQVRGVDTDRTELARARLAAKILGIESTIAFECEDVAKLQGEYDFCICAGGLHLIRDPAGLLRDLAKKIHGPLIIQSVVSLARTKSDYFVTPAPRSNSGSRFSYGWLRDTVRGAGWNIVESAQSELPGRRRREDRGSAWLLCVPPEYIESGLAKPAGEEASDRKQGLWDDPNKHARPSGIELGKAVTIHGYQEFQIRDGKVIPLENDPLLRRKQTLARPYFDPRFLTGKSLLDIGANGGFFSFWACQAGASQVVSLDMDEAYLSLIRKAQTHLGWSQIRPVNCRAQDWEEPADLVLAFAMIHWLYSCTANFGSLDAAVGKLASLTRLVLLIEWVGPEDPAIRFFKHTDWNAAQAKGPYTLPAFEEALRKHFHKVEIVGATSPTRTLYAACQQRLELSLDPALPLLAPVDRILHSRCLITLKGVDLYSRIYSGETSDQIIKQATGDLARHEAEVLRALSGPHFPRVLAVEQRESYSVLTLERISGSSLVEALPKVAATPRRLAAFMGEGLAILQELRAAGVEHRDIRLENFLVREDRPVLIDFGWGQQAGKPYTTPRNLGALERIPSGPTCDVYSMGKVFQQLVPENSTLFAPLLDLMVSPNLARNLALETLVQVLKGLELPEKWEGEPVFAALRPKAAPESGSSLVPGARPPYLKRTWRRWKRSIQKRIGRRRT